MQAFPFGWHAVGRRCKLSPQTLRAVLIDRSMTPQEVINNLKLLQKHGSVGGRRTLKLLVSIWKLEEAKTSKRVSTFKADDHALQRWRSMQATMCARSWKKWPMCRSRPREESGGRRLC